MKFRNEKKKKVGISILIPNIETNKMPNSKELGKEGYKLLNEILLTKIQRLLKRIIHYDPEGLVPRI